MSSTAETTADVARFQPGDFRADDTSITPTRVAGCLFPPPRAEPNGLMGWLSGVPGHALLLGISCMDWEFGDIGEEVQLLQTDVYAGEGTLKGSPPLPGASRPIEGDPSDRMDWVRTRLCGDLDPLPVPDLAGRIMDVVALADPARTAFMRAHGIAPRIDTPLADLFGQMHAGFAKLIAGARAGTGGAVEPSRGWDARGAPGRIADMTPAAAIDRVIFLHLIMSMPFGNAAFEVATDIRLCELHEKIDLGQISWRLLSAARLDSAITHAPHAPLEQLADPELMDFSMLAPSPEAARPCRAPSEVDDRSRQPVAAAGGHGRGLPADLYDF